MPTTHEFSILVDAQTLIFITFVVRLFLVLALGLAFFFSFIVAALYGSAKLLVYGYGVMLFALERAQQKKGVVM